MTKKIVYVDMDNVLVDFASVLAGISPDTLKAYEGQLDEVPGIFGSMPPLEGAVEAYHILCEHFDVYILSTAPWKNPTAWVDKRGWVQRYLGDNAHKRLILTHHKNLNMGDFLIDDRPNNGACDFTGEWIQFGSEKYPDWKTVLDYLLNKEKNYV